MKSWSEYLANETEKKETRVSRERARQLEESKKQTNADRIRSMSDEELAEFIKCPHDMHLGDCRAKENETIPCSECVLQWLKSEVKE